MNSSDTIHIWKIGQTANIEIEFYKNIDLFRNGIYSVDTEACMQFVSDIFKILYEIFLSFMQLVLKFIRNLTLAIRP